MDLGKDTIFFQIPSIPIVFRKISTFTRNAHVIVLPKTGYPTVPSHFKIVKEVSFILFEY